MGYNSNCIYQSCSSNCCNKFGTCPQSYSRYDSSYYSNCYYYYDGSYSSYSSYTSSALSAGAIIGIAFGCFFFCFILFIIIFCCVRRRNMDMHTSTGQQVIANGNPDGTPTQYTGQNLWAPQGYPQQPQPYFNGQAYYPQPQYISSQPMQPVIMNGYGNNQGNYVQGEYPQQQGQIFRKL